MCWKRHGISGVVGKQRNIGFVALGNVEAKRCQKYLKWLCCEIFVTKSKIKGEFGGIFWLAFFREGCSPSRRAAPAGECSLNYCIDKNLSNSLQLFIVFFGCWAMTMTSKKVSSVVHPHHVIRVTELLEQSLIQSLILTHHCYSLPCVYISTFTTVITSQHGLRPVAILREGLSGPPRFLLGPPFGSPSFFLNFKIVWLIYAGLPNAFCKNTGHFVNSARSKLCRNS